MDQGVRDSLKGTVGPQSRDSQVIAGTKFYLDLQNVQNQGTISQNRECRQYCPNIRGPRMLPILPDLGH